MPIQLDAIDMVISKQGFFSAVRFFMVPPTKGYRVQPDMDDCFSISPHAHAINMVHLCRLVANCTPAIFKAETTTPTEQRARNVVFQQMTHALGLDLLTDAQAEQLVQLCTPVKD